jgi:hypothetical protein
VAGPQQHSPRMGHHGNASMATHKQHGLGEYGGMHPGVYSAPMPPANGSAPGVTPANAQHRCVA